MTQTADPCVTLRHLRHPMTKARVTGDAPAQSCVTAKPQFRAVNDADDAGDAEIRTSDRCGPPRPREFAPLRQS
ncbi:hypothetical protein GCM10015536_17490 [Streptomyces griseomycini]|nr:hypothetical protein GCM10015536_17490 [Streptomyces griseomycini]